MPLLLGAMLFAPCAAPVQAQSSALTSRDSVILARFENQTKDPVFDGALDEALALELEQSPFLNVLSDRKVGEALRLMGRPANEPITLQLGRDLCPRTGSKAVLAGGIASQGAHYLLALTALACDGKVLVEEQREAPDQKEVLHALSEAAVRLRTRLGESSAERFAVPLNITTFSLDALKNYRLGVNARRDKGDTLSVPYLKRAIERDPRFPLPYSELTAIYNNLRQPSLALQYAAAAYRLRDRVGEREKLKITGIYLLVRGDLDKEIRNYKHWQTAYPHDFVPYNNLGNDYAAMGRLEESLAEYRQALQLMPSVIGYTNVAGIDLSLNRLDAAGAALDEAFAHHLDGRYLHQNQYWLAFLRGDARQMAQQVAWAAGKPGDEDALLSMQSDTEAYFGHMTKAQDFTRRAVDSAVSAGSTETAALWQVNAALRMAEAGNIDLAKHEVKLALALSSGRDVKLIAAFTLARAGDRVGARTLSLELLHSYPTDTLMKLYWVSTINAAIELAAGNSSAALKDLQAAAPYELGGANTFINYLYPAYERGQAYLHAHNTAAAIAEFQKLLDHPGVVSNFVTGALAQLFVGRAYAMAGETAKAQTAYQAFFMLWKDADPEVSVLTQARQEYAELQQHRG